MAQQPWMQPADQRGSSKRVSGSDKRLSIVPGAVRGSSKNDLQGSGRALEQALSTPLQQAAVPQSASCEPLNPASPRLGSMLASLKTHYRKLRTLKGTVRALMYLRRTPFSLNGVVKAATSAPPVLTEEQRSALSKVPRISTTATSTVQSQVHNLVANGHVVAEIDSTSGQEVTYRQQGNLDHYTEDNLAKRVSLQQQPHMIALTQRLWTCALGNGEKKLRFPDYERYMLCLHRLILPEFDIAASKDLIMDDWKRDSGGQDYLDYAYFHLSMFELVDLWTDTVEPEDYISLLFCIMHCLTFFSNGHHKLSALEDIHTVDILEESKEVDREGIEQDLQREINSESFAYYQQQVKEAAEANKRRANSPRTRQEENDRRRSQSRERRRSLKYDPAEGLASSQDLDTTAQGRRQSRSGSSSSSQGRRLSSSSSSYDQNGRRVFTQQASTHTFNFVADSSAPLIIQNRPSEPAEVSPRRDPVVQRATTPNVFTRGGGVILNVGMVDSLSISKPLTDGRPSVAVPTLGMSSFPRQRSGSASINGQNRRDHAAATKADGAHDSTVSQIESTTSVLRTGLDESATSGYLLLPNASTNKAQLPFTVRAAAVAEAAATMAAAAGPIGDYQLHTQLQAIGHGNEGSSITKTGENAFMDNSSLTAPLMTIVSSKPPTSSDRTSSIGKVHLQLKEGQEPKGLEQNPHRPHIPYGGEFLTSSSLASPRVGHALTAQVAAAFLSAQQIPLKPSTSPRPTLGAIQRSDTLNTDHPAATSPRRPQAQHDESRLLPLGAVSGLRVSAAVPLAISGKTATHAHLDVTTSPRQPIFRGHLLESSSFSPGTPETVTTINPPKDDLKALLSPRYIITNPIGSGHSPHSPSSPRQSVVRAQGSSRALANSPRLRQQPSRLITGPAMAHLQPHRQQRPSQLGLAITPRRS